MGQGSSKGGGGFMPNPLTGAPRNATPGLPSPGFGGNAQPGGPGFDERTGQSMPNQTYDLRLPAGDPNAPNLTMPNPMPAAPQTLGNQALGPQMGAQTQGMQAAGPSGGTSSPALLGSILKRWDSNGVGPNQPAVPGSTMQFTPGGGINPPPGGNGLPPPTGTPGMSPGNFGPTGQSGNSQNAIYGALATGNQAGLAGQGSQATNSDINGNFGTQGAADYYKANQVRLNRQGPAYQPGGMFYNPAIDGQQRGAAI